MPFARRAGLRGGAAAALAVLVLVSVPGLLIASTTATIDHGLLFLATAALILLALYRRTGSRAALVLAALPVGTMVGSKYTALYVLVAATVLIAARARRDRKALLDAAVFAASNPGISVAREDSTRWSISERPAVATSSR